MAKKDISMRGQEVVPSPWWYSLVAVLPVVLASGLGQLATVPNLVPWYAALHKPAFNPPNWLFGPIWTGLYALMAYAVWRVLHAMRQKSEKTTGLILFFAQLVFNALWPWLFFALQSPVAGLWEIVPQCLLILVTIGWFYRLDLRAALCLVPLAAWVGFATALNFALWRLNP